eukprot:TRINITY_DN1067_c0_g1_i1.p1 TRINITY_DN1067_c0_g1~~TRINITY_DN1067_c0_g1_i1.p1  ORF type:complete len:487 (-),score=116.20 TRINITY_DN1067_c0_g1_i1:33-1493(-)
MAVTWNGSSIFALVWVAWFIPVGCALTFKFYENISKQPIKSRVPEFSLPIGFVLVGYTVFICAQRLFANTYPCWLSLLQGFMGLILICNLYIARCIMLYAQFYSIDPDYASQRRNLWYGKHLRKLSSIPTLTKAGIILSTILLAPALGTIFGDSDVRNGSGDNCVRNAGFATSLMYAYAIAYLLVFLFITFKIRNIFDGFKIKQELAWTGVTLFLTVTLWVVFNYPSGTESINNNFSVSALILLVGIAVVLGLAIAWPLYMALYTPPRVSEEEAAKMQEELWSKGLEVEEGEESRDVLRRILKSQTGVQFFMSYCMAEYCVESLLLYSAIDTLKSDIENANMKRSLGQHIASAREMYERYLSERASLRVPEEAVSKQEADEILNALDELELDGDVDFDSKEQQQQQQQQHDIEGDEEKKNASYVSGLIEIFAGAQEGCFNYLLDFTYPTFLRSVQFKQLLNHVEDVRKELEIYKELNLVDTDPQAA